MCASLADLSATVSGQHPDPGGAPQGHGHPPPRRPQRSSLPDPNPLGFPQPWDVLRVRDDAHDQGTGHGGSVVLAANPQPVSTSSRW
jgi:hypothetical protein